MPRVEVVGRRVNPFAELADIPCERFWRHKAVDLGQPGLLDADAVEVGAWIGGCGVGVNSGAILAREVALEGGKGGLNGQVCGALEEVGLVADALPTDAQ